LKDESKQHEWVFGPVPSRRLGRSLGVDLVPFKTCTFDCIYCQLGLTTCKTVEMKEWAPTQKIIENVRRALPETSPDYVTVSGSGEPTLHSKLADIIEAIKSITDIPVALLTNGSLFWRPDVRDAALMADLVIPSLDAGTEKDFLEVNRPHESLSLEMVIDGLLSFSGIFKGRVWLEIFLLEGINMGEPGIAKMIEVTNKMKPERIQLNTVSRPPCEAHAKPVSKERMESVANRFGPNCEVIADFQHVHALPEFSAKRDDVLVLLKHRPCTMSGIAAGLGIHVNEATKYVQELLERNEIKTTKQSGEKYYVPV